MAENFDYLPPVPAHRLKNNFGVATRQLASSIRRAGGPEALHQSSLLHDVPWYIVREMRALVEGAYPPRDEADTRQRVLPRATEIGMHMGFLFGHHMLSTVDHQRYHGRVEEGLKGLRHLHPDSPYDLEHMLGTTGESLRDIAVSVGAPEFTIPRTEDDRCWAAYGNALGYVASIGVTTAAEVELRLYVAPDIDPKAHDEMSYLADQLSDPDFLVHPNDF